jgi:hypothetical protein
MDSMNAGGLGKPLALARASAIEQRSPDALHHTHASVVPVPPPPAVGRDAAAAQQQQHHNHHHQRRQQQQQQITTTAHAFSSPQRRQPTHPPDEFGSPPPEAAPMPPLGGSTPVAAAIPAGTSAFLAHCQVTPPTYPQIPRRQLTVPTGPDIYERMWAVRRGIEGEATAIAGSKQLRGGSTTATKQLELQLDLLLRDYCTRLNRYLKTYTSAVLQQQLLLQERNGLLGTAHAGDSNPTEAKLLHLTQGCLQVIESAVQGFTHDATQLLGKFREQQKKKEKLPEPAVDALNAWLHEHFHNPYPTKKEKEELVARTGLEMKQINQWFINARVRVWKPAVRMMMQERTGAPAVPTSVEGHFEEAAGPAADY